jgi:hypothetical protein
MIVLVPETPELGRGEGGAAAPVALYQEGQGGQRCPFNLKDCLSEIANCQKCLGNSFTNLLQKTQEMQSSSFKNSTIAWRRTPHTPIIQSIENMIRRSSTPDILQTPLSIYQFKSALSRKSAPLAFTSFRRPWLVLMGGYSAIRPLFKWDDI